MARILQTTVTPFNAQVLLTTLPDAEHPQWITGSEPAVASATAIAVATSPDLDGDGHHVVTVEVLVDESPSEGRRVFECALLVSSWGVAIGDTVSTMQRQASVPAGDYEAAIYVDPATAPNRVWLVLTNA